MTLLDVRNLRVAFGGKEVVHGIDFSVNVGEKLALVGESGSGKTVTAMSLLRLLPEAQVTGTINFLEPEPSQTFNNMLSISEQKLRGIRGQDISFIFQEPMTALNPLMTVGQQIAEVLELKRGIKPKQAILQAIEALAETGIPEPERRAKSYPHQLSGGQRQRAMIAMAIACQPRLLLADEPTTALDVSLRAQILDLLSRLQEKNGMAVLMITHDLNLVRRFADRVIVMENGLIVEQGLVAEVFSNPTHSYTKRLIDSRPARDNRVSGAKEPTVLLEAKQLRVSYPTPLPGLAGWFKSGAFVAVKGADFILRKGQTLGVMGESGSGKSTLALAALGLMPFEGQLRVAGAMWNKDANSNRNLRQAVQVVFQDPFSSLSPRMTVEEIVGEGLSVHAASLSLTARQQRVLSALGEVGLSEDQFPGILQRYPHEFSGGQRQRIAIARALIVEPELMILDEPTSALDVTIQKQVLELLQQLQFTKGLSYLLITHDVDVIRAMAHHVLVMKEGEVLESGSLTEILDHPNHPYTRILLSSAG